MILARASARNLLRHPWQSVLSIIGVALGVAVVVAIDIANDSARRAYSLSNQLVTGRATHHIVGGPIGLNQELYRRLRVEHGLRTIRPVVEGTVRLPDHGNRKYRVVGFDPFAQTSLGMDYQLSPEVGPGELVAGPNAALLLDDTVRGLGLAVPADLRVRGDSQTHALRVIAVVEAASAMEIQAIGTALLTDISTAQLLTGNIGRLSRIDLELPDDAAVEFVRSKLTPGAELISSASRNNALRQMTRAFEINLTAMSLLALVVAMFLIYNTMTVSVLQRKNQIATYRTLGVGHRQLFAWIALEATALGAVGVVGGIGLGLWLSQTLLAMVTQTINDLYFTLEVNRVTIESDTLFKGVLLGLGATVAAALAPAYEASRVPPQITYVRSAQEIRARGSVRTLALVSALPALAALGLLIVPTQNLYLGFAGLFFAIFAFALLAPALLLLIVRTAHPILSRGLGLIGLMAGRGVWASLSRVRVTIAALSIAVSATVGVAIMITSFRATVEHWLENYLRADIYVSTVSSAGTGGVDPALIRRVAEMPGVATITTARWTKIEDARGSLQLLVIDDDLEAFKRFQLKYGDTDKAWPQFVATDAVIVSEPYAYRNNLEIGDVVRMRTDRGGHKFSIAGVYYDYGSDRGVVAMHRDTYRRHWSDTAISSFAIYLEAETDTQRFLETLESSVLAHTELAARSNRALRALSLEIFDRTFAVTGVLRVLTIVIAAIGIFSALMSIQLERGREFAVLRANGFTPRQLWALVTTETGLLGFAAGVMAIPLGLFLALALIFVINRRSFGWTMQIWLTPEHFVQGILLAAAAGIVAGIYPALRLARTPPSFELRHE